MPNKATMRQSKYDASNAVYVGLKLNRSSDADIIAAIDTKNKQGSIKKLIRAGMLAIKTANDN